MQLLRVSFVLLAHISFLCASSSSSQVTNTSAPGAISIYERLRDKEAEWKAARLAESKRKYNNFIDLTIDTTFSDLNEDEVIIFKRRRPFKRRSLFLESSSDEETESEKDKRESGMGEYSPIPHMPPSVVVIDFDPAFQQLRAKTGIDTNFESIASPTISSKEERFCEAIRRADWKTLSACWQSSVYEFEQSGAVLGAIEELISKNESEQIKRLFTLYPRFRMLKSVVEVVLKTGNVVFLADLLHQDYNITSGFLQEIKSLFSSEVEYSNFLWQMMVFGNDSLAVIQAYVASTHSFVGHNFSALLIETLEAVITEAVRNNSLGLIDAIAAELGAEPFNRQTYQSRNYRGNAFVHLHYNAGMARRLLELGVDLNSPVTNVNTGAQETLLTHIYRQGEPRTRLYLRHSHGYTMETLKAAKDEAIAAGNEELLNMVSRMLKDLKHRK